MNKMSVIEKTLVALVMAFMCLIVIIPLLFFTAVAFSNAIEVNSFPKALFASNTVTVKIVPQDGGKYELLYDYGKGEGYESILTSAKTSNFESHFRRQYGIEISGDELFADWEKTRTEGPMEFTYKKTPFENFIQFFKVVPNAMAGLKNSIIVSIYTIIISLVFGSLGGYAIARYRFKGREQINVALLIVRMFPTVGISVSMAVILIKMGLFDTMIGLALIYSVPNIALTSWITSSIFVGISKEMEEASLIFGANSFQTFKNITLPLAFPAMAASSMYSFLTAWNDTISALILTNKNQTLALVVYKAIGSTSSGIQYAAAGSIVLILPALVFTFIIRKYIGQMWGGVKL